jgi:hypothetical protein
VQADASNVRQTTAPQQGRGAVVSEQGGPYLRITRRAGVRPDSTSSKDSLTSSSLRSSAMTRVRPWAWRSKTSARSWRVPTSRSR